MVYIHFVHANGQNSASVHTRAVLTIGTDIFHVRVPKNW